ncbi:MAG: FAD-dependent oxidoreductase [Chloroflexi bacterium OHK40]
MPNQTADVVICGAGLAGVAAAYYLAVGHGIRDIVLVDEREPLSLTSSSSTECYRNWWPGPGDAMVRLMNRSIDLLEAIARETDNRIALNRRGYLFATGDPARIDEFVQAAEESARLGAGPARVHRGAPGDPEYLPAPAEGWEGLPTGADVIIDRALIRRHFPYLTDRAVVVLHARRCGWLSAAALGHYLLEQARAAGARLLRGSVTGVEVSGGRVRGVQLGAGAGGIATERFVNAAGPSFKPVGAMLGLELPVFCELHMRATFEGDATTIPMAAPLVIWMDPTSLYHSARERAELERREDGPALLAPYPPGVHLRPAGTPERPQALGLWTFDMAPREPLIPPPVDQHHGELTLRGLASVIPSLATLVERGTPVRVDAGYYTKTAENRPLIGPTPVEGAYLMGAISGFGVMGACGFGELLAAHLTGADLPDYAAAFLLSRYDDPAYQQLLGRWGSSGQL